LACLGTLDEVGAGDFAEDLGDEERFVFWGVFGMIHWLFPTCKWVGWSVLFRLGWLLDWGCGKNLMWLKTRVVHIKLKVLFFRAREWITRCVSRTSLHECVCCRLISNTLTISLFAQIALSAQNNLIPGLHG
jgi:hypothetical protein